MATSPERSSSEVRADDRDRRDRDRLTGDRERPGLGPDLRRVRRRIRSDLPVDRGAQLRPGRTGSVRPRPVRPAQRQLRRALVGGVRPGGRRLCRGGRAHRTPGRSSPVLVTATRLVDRHDRCGADPAPRPSCLDPRYQRLQRDSHRRVVRLGADQQSPHRRPPDIGHLHRAVARRGARHLPHPDSIRARDPCVGQQRRHRPCLWHLAPTGLDHRVGHRRCLRSGDGDPHRPLQLLPGRLRRRHRRSVDRRSARARVAGLDARPHALLAGGGLGGHGGRSRRAPDRHQFRRPHPARSDDVHRHRARGALPQPGTR